MPLAYTKVWIDTVKDMIDYQSLVKADRHTDSE